MGRVVALLSGGLDSCTVVAKAVAEGHDVVALSFDYAQRHSKELDCARAIAKHFGIRHQILTLPLGELGGSSLTDTRIDIPSSGSDSEIGSKIPSTYVPGRNTIFLSFALALAEVENAEAILLGVNALDYSGYPDCRPEYLTAIAEVAKLATKQGVDGHAPKLLAPLMKLDKAGIVELAATVNAPLHLTWSCYRGEATSCGTCESCRLRLKGFVGNQSQDPLPYRLTHRPDSDYPIFGAERNH